MVTADQGWYVSTSCCISDWPKWWGRAIFDPLSAVTP